MVGDTLFSERPKRPDAVVTLLLTLVACFAGCSEDATTASVSGIVRLDGKPLPLGIIRFIPSAGRPASGEIQSDGTFTLGTYGKKDGALIGKHRVTVTAIQSDAPVADPIARQNVSLNTKRNPNLKRLVPTRYNGPTSSRLTFEVKPGQNHAEFDLTSR